MVHARLLVAALVVAATACRTVVPITPLSPGDPRPAAHLDRWNDSVKQRHALRGRARLAVDGDDGAVRFSAKQVVVLERPARLRVEVLGFLNQTAAVVTTDGERYEVFRSGDRSYDTGAVHPGLLWREAHLALTPEEAVDLLVGATVSDGALVPERAVELGDGWIRTDLVDTKRRLRRRATFDPASRLRELEVLDEDGQRRWNARFEAYKAVADVPVAHEITLEVATGSARVEISLDDVELNPELPPDIFRLRAPAPTPVGVSAEEGG